MKKNILRFAVVTMLISSCFADTIGFEAGAAFWKPSLDGKLQNRGAVLDLKDNLDLNSDVKANFFWALIEHPLPIIPNIKIEKTNFSTSGNASLGASILGNTYNANEKVDLTIDQIDFKLYYEVLDNWVNLDAGIDIKNVSGNLEVGNDNKNLDVIIPMLYLKAKFDLPFSGFSLETDISHASYNGSKVQDLKAALLYETSIGLGATFGYKKQTIVLDDIDDYNADIDISGPYIGAFYHF